MSRGHHAIRRCLRINNNNNNHINCPNFRERYQSKYAPLLQTFTKIIEYDHKRSNNPYFFTITNNYHTNTKLSFRLRAYVSSSKTVLLTRSNTIHTTPTSLDNNQQQKEPIILYEQNRTTLPRSLLAFTTLHTSYWTWYVMDFTPAINSKAAQDVTSMLTSVDPTIGYFGLTFSIFMSMAAVLYPTCLIQKISLHAMDPSSSQQTTTSSTTVDADNSNSDTDTTIQKVPTTARATRRKQNEIDISKMYLAIQTFQLPFVTIPSSSSSSKYKVVQKVSSKKIIFDNTNEITTLFQYYNGDLRLLPTRHLPIHVDGYYMNLLLHIVNNNHNNNSDGTKNDLVEEEIKNHELLVECLSPIPIPKMHSNSRITGNANTTSSTSSNHNYNPTKLKYRGGKKKGGI